MQTKNIWLLAGYAGSGKTTAAEILASHLSAARLTAFAKKVKDEVATQYKISRSLLETQEGKSAVVYEQKTARDLLIEHSAQVKQRTNDPGIWAEYVKIEIQNDPSVENWIVHDWRYLAELHRMQSIHDAVIHTIRIINNRVVPTTSPSEHELDRQPVDTIIWNIGTKDDLGGALQNLIHTNRKLVYR